MLRLCVLALGLFLAAPSVSAAEVPFASVPLDVAAPLTRQAEPPLILDVREPEEFAAGHVPGALNVPLRQVRAWAADQPKDRPILVICQSGRRSLRASAELAELGFTQVTNVQGGFRAWREGGHPVVTPVATP